MDREAAAGVKDRNGSRVARVLLANLIGRWRRVGSAEHMQRAAAVLLLQEHAVPVGIQLYTYVYLSLPTNSAANLLARYLAWHVRLVLFYVPHVLSASEAGRCAVRLQLSSWLLAGGSSFLILEIDLNYFYFYSAL